MATFTFNGTVLTIVDDNGNVVSQDLQGPEGKIGIRGPQGAPGRAGVDGTVTFESLTEDQIAMIQGPQGLKGDKGDQGEQGPQGKPGVDGSNYVLTPADRVEIAEEIVTISGDGSINLNDYYTKAETNAKLNSVYVGTDGRTILRDGNGNLKTAIGGYWDNGYTVEAIGLNRVCDDSREFYVVPGADYINLIEAEIEYHWQVKFSDGFTEAGTVIFEDYVTGTWLNCQNITGGTNVVSIGVIGGRPEGAVNGNGVYVDVVPYDGSLAIDEFYLWIAGVGHYVPVDANFIPVDGTSIVINSDGKLSANGVAGDFVLTEAMKAEIVAEVIASMPTYGGETETV